MYMFWPHTKQMISGGPYESCVVKGSECMEQLQYVNHFIVQTLRTTLQLATKELFENAHFNTSFDLQT